MNIQRFALGITIAASLLSCGPSRERKEELEKAAAKEELALTSSTAAKKDPQDSTHQFIRKADLKFKTNDVVHSTYDIEHIVQSQHGFVTFTQLNSDVSTVSSIPISADSLLESTYYTVSNTMSIRVPNSKLDTTLKLIARNVQFLDSRLVTAEDVALQIKANKLEEKRLVKSEGRLSQSLKEPEKKLKEKTAVEDLLSKKEERHDEVLIQNLSLQDEINFSTIHLLIYQNKSVKFERLAIEKNTIPYEPGFGSKVLTAFSAGWSALQVVVLFFVNIWPLMVFGGMVFFMLKKFEK